MSDAICLAYSGLWFLAEAADTGGGQIEKLVIGGMVAVMVLPGVFWSRGVSSAVLGVGIFWLGWLIYGAMLPDDLERVVIAEVGVMREVVGCILYAGPMVAAGVWGVVGEGGERYKEKGTRDKAEGRMSEG
jgi:hypothetical protein